ncbi:uncharacterized protein LOC117572456 isoform X1 [Drosophila albomicans]|uniref:Uncharacterized protein LOC117572456 isoform X1 n=1 Tax=Drosophila albomicans TaxID=7291 RepID=A0A6P8XIA0_DROAB|nr:uncharacterized protein LOC117572456 isoform X1 [Drosophila albomicans]
MAASAESTPYNFEEEFEAYLHRIFYIKPYTEESKCDPSIVEYFGVFSLTDIRAPERKLWYIYYCKQPDIDETVDRIFQKYGKKNVCELFRKPIFSGVSLRTRVKTHFSELKWYVKGNLLEAPPKSHYNDERMAKTITDLYNDERKMLYNYICMKHNAFSRYN